MSCTQCGVELEPQDRYCCQCGKRTGVGSPWPNRAARQPLTLSTRNKIAGVCAGFANYFDVDVTLVRIIWLILVFVPPGAGLIGYLLAWLLMPKDESGTATVTEPAIAR